MSGVAAGIVLTFSLLAGLPKNAAPAAEAAAVALASEACGGALAERFGLERRPVRVVLYPGSVGEPMCRGTFAATRLNGTVVMLCVAQFGPLDARRARDVVIHEVLHSLGLPESPAYQDALTSRQISEIVRTTCRVEAKQTD